MFGNLLSNFRTTVLLSLVLAGVMIYAFGSVAPGGFDLIFWQAVFRWTHVVAGILWIGCCGISTSSRSGSCRRSRPN